MNTQDIRRLFTDFFAERGHRRVPSSSLIPPPDEKTLLFSNAGMNQMKPYFMAMAEPPSPRMTSIQKCFRTSDIEEVGDNSHCTFFEMLGNFSVGDYFKAEVIPWAWQLLTDPEPKGMGLDKSKIWTTVYLDDDEAFDVWRSVGIPAERIVRFDESENYWFMIKGGAGPCGPNTEIYYDFGAEHGCGQADCSPPTHDCGRFLEIWNLVFMSLYQEEDGKTRRPLPKKNVDTGAGLERWLPVYMWQNQVDWQGQAKEWASPPTIYDGDVLRPILDRVSDVVGRSYDDASEHTQRAMRIIAEHARAATFLIGDGVMPSNEGRGYVLRRMLRRAVYFLSELGREEVVLSRVQSRVIDVLSGEYPDLVDRAQMIVGATDAEERRFRERLERGRMILSDRDLGAPALRRVIKRNLTEGPDQRGAWAMKALQIRGMFSSSVLPEAIVNELVTPYERLLGSEPWKASDDLLFRAAELPLELTGRAIFILWDTYGFPPELTREIATAFDIAISAEASENFETLMGAQRERSRAATRFEGDSERIQTYAELGLHPTEFVGYETTRANAHVASILLDGSTIVRELTAAMMDGHRVEITLDQTPFYAEGGGQVGDHGEVLWPGGRFVVEDTQSVGDGGVVAHVGRLEAGSLSIGDPIEARVDESRRGDTMRNHTATHILHAALRKVVGTHVRQAGSLVTPDRLRFDFTHLEALTPEQLREVETLANKVVRENLSVHIEHKSYEEALADGALAFFGDKYADVVRVVGVCDLDLNDCFSHELCGGTHVHASGEVGGIIVTGETSIGAGLRRIEAVTGRVAAERQRYDEETLARLSAGLRVPVPEIESRVAAMREENDRLRKQIETMERRMARGEADSFAANATQVDGVNVVVTRVPDASSGDALREMGDGLKSKLGSSVILLGAVIDGKPTFIAMSTPDVSKRVPAGDVVRAAAQAAGGNGGGRPELAQGGGADASKLDAALAAARKLIEEKLGA